MRRLLVVAVLVVAGCSGESGSITPQSVVGYPDSRVIELEYGVCASVEVEVQETPTEVLLTTDVGRDTGDDCAGGARVTLDEPLGTRRVRIDGTPVDELFPDPNAPLGED
jgi:hypothetical protein